MKVYIVIVTDLNTRRDKIIKVFSTLYLAYNFIKDTYTTDLENYEKLEEIDKQEIEKSIMVAFLKEKSAILIKMPKTKQNRKVDLPTIGITTLKNCLIANINGIVIAKKHSLIIDKDLVIEFVNRNNIFLLAQ